MRRLLALLALAAALCAAPAAVQAQGGDTTAVAVNTKDGAAIFKFAFQVRRTMQDTVDNTNAAVAYASCTECRTVAIAFQVVLVMSDASTVTPENLAIAINQDCTLCDTAAFAYQFVLGTDGHVHFTAEGNKAIAELRKRIRALDDPALSDDQIAAELDAIAQELGNVLASELVATGKPEPETEATPETAATPEPTATPDAAATPEAAATPSPDTTPTPEPTATATP
jgi:putative peptide zinc metalloprotease protein